MKFFEKIMISDYLEEKKSKKEIQQMWKKMGWDVDVIEKGEAEGYPKGWTEIHPKDKKGFMKKFGVSYASLINEAPLASKGWTDKSISKFGKTIGKDPTEKGFFDVCVSRMSGKEGFDEKKAKGFCASIKDKSMNSTYWRGKGKSKKEVAADVKKDRYKK